LYPAGAGKSRYGFDQIASLIEQIEPAIIFLLYDIVDVRMTTIRSFLEDRVRNHHGLKGQE
jgi:hypothetical protein